MNRILEAELYRATALTFEQLGFMLGTPELSKEQRRARFEAAVGVVFHGPLRGQLILSVSGGILPAIVANMLGEARPDDFGACNDALGELANVICGNVLPEVAGPEAIFLLDPPAPVAEREVRSRDVAGAARIRIGLEDGRADVLFCVEEASL